MNYGEQRRIVLEEALRKLGSLELNREDSEARVVAKAMLAQQDGRYLPEAKRAFEEAEAVDISSNWISLYMAEASFSAGDVGEALR